MEHPTSASALMETPAGKSTLNGEPMEQDPEFDRLIAWFVQNRREIAEAANVRRIIIADEDSYDAEKMQNPEPVFFCEDWSGDLHLVRDPKRIFERFQPKPLPVITTVRSDKRVGPNERCPCGSGKKYKKCCMNKGG